MEELIKKVYEEKLKDGTIEKIIEDNISKLVDNCCYDLFSYNGVIRKQLEQKLGEVMSNIVERSDFSQYVQKLTYIINKVLPDTAVSDYKRISKSIEEICGQKVMARNSTIKLSEIFKKYCETIKEECFSTSDFSWDYEFEEENGVSEADLTLKVENKYNQISFFIDCDELDYNYRFTIKKDGDHLNYDKNFKISDLRYMNKFETFLIMLTINEIKIDYDIENEDEKEIWVTMED